jgi:KipI family sensor histidine kinase inhibitor
VIIEPLGDSAVQIVLGDAPDEATRQRIAACAAAVVAARTPGLVDCVPGFTTLTLHYDPGVVRLDRLVERIRVAIEAMTADPPPDDGRVVRIPVCYGGPHGPDLDEVAGRCGLTPDRVAQLHSAGEYRVHLLGFLPGFPYLAGLDPRLATPRRDQPRTRVPAGSVAIGGGQTGVYPLDSPGGWHLIGRTPLRLFDPRRDPPALLRPGDRVSFDPISPEELERMEAER